MTTAGEHERREEASDYCIHPKASEGQAVLGLLTLDLLQY